MALKEFILQGLSQRSHVQAVQEAFDIDGIEKVLISVAYVKESGVEKIEGFLRANAANVTIFAGIRNDITSYQALRRLREIAGLTLYTFDTGTPNITFHPKVYFIRGAERARMVLGSANLTLGGLQNNIEAGMLFTFDLSDADDLAVVGEIVSQIEALPVTYPDNTTLIGSVDAVEALFDNGLISDELDAPPPRSERTARTTVAGQGSRERVPRIRLPLNPLRANHSGTRTRPINAVVRTVTAPPPVPPAVGPAVSTVVPVVVPPAPQMVPVPELVWQSKPLTERDLNVPTGPNTNKTGSVSLDKGLLNATVDHRHYFRDVVFPRLSWGPRKPTVDEAFAKFQLVIKGVNYGEFDLPIRHTTSTNTRSYEQKNAMTRLSWGPVSEYVGQTDLIGLTLSLYREPSDPTRFLLEID